MDRIEQVNLEQIEMLNQRGGRTLSIVDLMRAGTIPPEMAAWAYCAIRDGVSFLTAANPGGAGKTTLMAALLGFLPTGEKLRTVGLHASRVPRGHSDHGVECLLSHEIGQGAYFGYLWGQEARTFFQAPSRGVRVTTNLHADTMKEMQATLQGPEIGLEDDHFNRIGFIAFMAYRLEAGGAKRRVSSLWAAREGGHGLLWEWDETADRFLWRPKATPERTLPPAQRTRYPDATLFMRKLKEEGPREYAAVRRIILEFMDATG